MVAIADARLYAVLNTQSNINEDKTVNNIDFLTDTIEHGVNNQSTYHACLQCIA